MFFCIFAKMNSMDKPKERNLWPYGYTRIKESPITEGGFCVMLGKEQEMTFRGETFKITMWYWHDIETKREFTDNECPDFMWDLFRAYCEKHYDTFTEIWPEMKK